MSTIKLVQLVKVADRIDNFFKGITSLFVTALFAIFPSTARLWCVNNDCSFKASYNNNYHLWTISIGTIEAVGENYRATVAQAANKFFLSKEF